MKQHLLFMFGQASGSPTNVRSMSISEAHPQGSWGANKPLRVCQASTLQSLIISGNGHMEHKRLRDVAPSCSRGLGEGEAPAAWGGGERGWGDKGGGQASRWVGDRCWAGRGRGERGEAGRREHATRRLRCKGELLPPHVRWQV